MTDLSGDRKVASPDTDIASRIIAKAGLPAQVLDAEDLLVPATSRGYQVTSDILVSHWIPAFNPQFLRRFGVKSILSLDGKHKPDFAVQLGVDKIVVSNMPDGRGTTSQMILNLVEKLRDLVTHHPSVLVHCNAGQSRSPAVVAAYLAIHEGFELNQALDVVKRARAPEREVKYWPEVIAAIREALEDERS